MSVPFRWLKKELEDQGFSIVQTNKGHFWVLSPDGRKLITFAATHGTKARRNEIHKCYVVQVRKVVRQFLENSK